MAITAKTAASPRSTIRVGGGRHRVEAIAAHDVTAAATATTVPAVDITSALICNYAEVREGLLFIAGGGVTRLVRPEYPAALGICVAVVMEGTEGEVAGIPHDIQLVVRDTDGQLVAEVKGGFQAGDNLHLEPGELVQLPIAFNLTGVVVPAAGAYDIDVAIDGGHLAGQPERTVTIRATTSG
jgi:hypothetical protein